MDYNTMIFLRLMFHNPLPNVSYEMLLDTKGRPCESP